MASAGSCRIGFNPSPSAGAGSSRKNGFEVKTMNRQNAKMIAPCTASTPVFSPSGRLLPKHRYRGAEQGKHQHPEQHGAFVIAPDAGHLVEQRLCGMRVEINVRHREIGNHIRVHQGGEGERDQRDQADRGRVDNARDAHVARTGRVERCERLRQRHEQRQNEREVPEFNDHI